MGGDREQAISALVDAAVRLERSDPHRQAAAVWWTIATLLDDSDPQQELPAQIRTEYERRLGTIAKEKWATQLANEAKHAHAWALLWAAQHLETRGGAGAARVLFMRVAELVLTLERFPDAGRWAGDSFVKAACLSLVQPEQQAYAAQRRAHYIKALESMEVAYRRVANDEDRDHLLLRAYQAILSSATQHGGFGGTAQSLRERLRLCRRRIAWRRRQYLVASLLSISGRRGTSIAITTWLALTFVVFPIAYWLAFDKQSPAATYVLYSLLLATTSGVWNLSPQSSLSAFLTGSQVLLSYSTLAILVWLLIHKIERLDDG